jgi:glycosyltransferase involved in cell wall biosynthesis
MTTPHPRRIVVASHSHARVGGVEGYVASIVPALRAAGHEVACWFETAGAGTDQVVAREGANRLWFAADEADGGVAAVRAWGPEVVYAQGVTSPVHERALMALAPAVFFAHSYYGACISGTKTFRVPVIRTCDRAFGPACLGQFYPRRCGGLNPVTLARQYALQRERLEILRDYRRILVASRHMAVEYGRYGLDALLRVVALPVEFPEIDARATAASRAGADGDRSWRLLFLGRFEETKGVRVALESARLLASSSDRLIEMQVSGEGSLRGRIEAEAAQLTSRYTNLRVRVTSWLTPQDAAAALDRADLLLVPSMWPEPFGMVGVEAARRAVPAVAFAVGGIAEWLTDGVTGTLLDAANPTADAIARAVTAILSDPARHGRMRAACLESARRFRMDVHLRHLDDVFEEVAGARGRAA